MTTSHRTQIIANGHSVEVRYGGASGDYISLTDIARYRTTESPGYVIQNWMRNRNTIRFLGLWERLHNPQFNYLEFEAIESQSGLNSFALVNMESMNAELIKLGLPQYERAARLNRMAIEQMQSLETNEDIRLLE